MKHGSNASNVSSIASLVNGQMRLVGLPHLAPVDAIALRKTANFQYTLP